MLRITSLQHEPSWEIEYQSTSPWQGPVDVKLPILRARTDRSLSGINAILITADLQGREVPNASGEQRLLGQRLAEELVALAECGEIPDLESIGVILAGDLYTVPQLDKMGGTGDVRPVWREFARMCAWVAGVAGNHDLFSGKASNPMSEDFLDEKGIYFLDESVVELNGLRISGLSGIIGRPTKLWRRSEEQYIAALQRLLEWEPDILVLHDGPDVSERRLRGTIVIREALESSTRTPLLVRGHAHWDVPLAELSNGIQVLNVDSRAVLLQQPGASE